MLDELTAFVQITGESVIKLAWTSMVLGTVFTVLTLLFACNPGRPWWRKRDLITDLCYWFLIPLITRYVRIGLLVLGAAVLFGIYDAKGLVDFYEHGHGPLAALPLWAQAVLFLVVSDFLLYWIHRGFHRPRMWKFHAVHHSSEELDWLSTWRFHPVNLFLGSVAVDVFLLIAGISPNVLVFIGPFTMWHSVFVHANLNWTLGPFKYALAGPVFHRWHHTAAERGGSKNFAATFPILDLMFGTFYMPPKALPDRYGVADRDFPPSFGEQLLYPFKR